MTRILMVVDDGGGGGTFRVGHRLALGLAERFDLVFATHVDRCDAEDLAVLADAGVTVIALGHSHFQASRAVHDLATARATIDLADPDGIYFIDSSVHSSRALKQVAQALAIPFASMVNLVPPPREGVDMGPPAAGGIVDVFVSKTNRAHFRALFPTDATPSEVIANGISDAFFRSAAPMAREATRRALGVGDNAFVLLHLARIEPRKGQHLSVEALARLDDTAADRPVRLVFVGSGGEREAGELAARVEAADLGRRVAILGPRRDVGDLIDAADAVIFPSYGEGDPLVPKEAMSKGRPVIVSDLAEIREQGHPVEMIVPDPNVDPAATVDGLVAVIDRLRRDPVAAAEIGRRSRRIAEARFAEADMVAAHRAVLERLPPRCREATPPVRTDVSPLEIGRTVRLGDPVVAWSILTDGWGEIERDGVWSLGEASGLVLMTERPLRSLLVTLEVEPLAGLRGGRPVTVRVDGRRLVVWRFLKRRSVKRRLHIVSSEARSRFVVRFEQRDPATPHELGLGDDHRRLGLFLRSLRIDAVPPPSISKRLWRRLVRLSPIFRR